MLAARLDAHEAWVLANATQLKHVEGLQAQWSAPVGVDRVKLRF